ncbi:hypothetical protein GCM10020367_56610 [Streptomyces sannanensis]|uniref:Uncharacterized protein n=1 Tax=Streptomyces sannanensis TaxID=285536 RepID=A0ABP6SJB4_9ACTN
MRVVKERDGVFVRPVSMEEERRLQRGLILEVVVVRRPNVFVRPVSMDEDRRPQQISRDAKAPVRLCRAIVVLMSAQARPSRTSPR